MSKKKATMTLKDFHGGSIPSDLRLPSAPGVMARPADRGSFDQNSPWGNSMGRSNQRLRPASAGSARNFDDKTPFLSHSTHIGRNFDEDERKPLDGLSGPRRTVIDESIHAPPSHVVEPRMDNSAGAKVGSQQFSTPSHLSGGPPLGSYSARLSEIHNVGSNNQTVSGSVSSSNPWGVKKEVARVRDPVSAAWSAPDAAVKLAHASAIEKVTSGRWHSQSQSQHIHPQKEVEAVGHLEPKREFQYRGKEVYNRNVNNGIDLLGGTDYHDAALVKHMEWSHIADDGIRKEALSRDRVRSTMYVETHERNPVVNNKDLQPRSTAGVTGETELQSPGTLEISDRPKLKLLPRSKPVENLELPVDYNKPEHQSPRDPVHVRDDNELHRIANPIEPGGARLMAVSRVVERPKLNLKPRSQPLEQLEGNAESKRQTVFAGARPREEVFSVPGFLLLSNYVKYMDGTVLKERGIDGVAVEHYDSQPPSRVKQDAPKIEPVPVHAPTPAADQRAAKNSDRRDHRKGNENWRNHREVDKPNKELQPQKQERPPSPDTWRKPVGNPKPDSGPTPGQRFGKVASPLELAQAFSRPVSDPKIADRLSGPQGIPGRGQMPFSRLTSRGPRPQINGY